MSPFDLTGPEFLLFYLILGAVVLILLKLWHNAGESGDAIRANLSDPYSIAFLRGGRNEMIRIATVSLIDRGLLQVSGTKVSTADNAAHGVRSPLEREILAYYASSKEAVSIFSGHACSSIADQYENDLAQLGALPDASVKSARMVRFAAAVIILWTIAAIKIAVALARGRTNVQFLIILAIVFAIAAYKISNPRMTSKGQVLVRDLRALFDSLKDRVSMLRPGATPNELALLGAVFGIAAIPSGLFPYTKTLYPRAAKSGGDGCGSSCGGGGCGGGCGGCGS